MKTLISVIVPLYNEEEVIGESYRRLTQVMSSMEEDYELIFVNDGSRDKTFDLARGIQEKDPHVVLVDFSRNFGHQIAITAGMDMTRGDAVIVIDADLQDPPELIPKMVEMWRGGAEVVYGKRASRQGETAFKKLTAFCYYRVLDALSGWKIPKDTGDFRLMDRKVADVLRSMPEHNRFLRGMVSWLGFRQVPLEFVREERFAGTTKYPLKKMLKLASDGIVSFSGKPFGIMRVLGGLLLAAGLVDLLALLIAHAVTGASGGWPYVIAAVLAVLPYMTRCTFLDMDSCGVSNTAMAAIRDAYPDIKVVWRVWFGDVYTCRTDVKRLLASSESHYINDATSDGLYYCTDVVWLDIGHSSLYDLSFLYNMPDLEVCIVACAPWSDATPIGSLEKLEYLEILSTNCNDISSFANLKNLKHLNIGNCWQIRDITPLYGLTQLERLWIGCVTPVPAEQKEEIREKLPDTLINTQVANHKEGGWCKDENGYNVPRYALLREQFGDYKSWAYAYPWSDILYTKSIDELTPEETQQIKP